MSFLKMAKKVLSQKILKSKQTKTHGILVRLLNSKEKKKLQKFSKDKNNGLPKKTKISLSSYSTSVVVY